MKVYSQKDLPKQEPMYPLTSVNVIAYIDDEPEVVYYNFKKQRWIDSDEHVFYNDFNWIYTPKELINGKTK